MILLTLSEVHVWKQLTCVKTSSHSDPIIEKYQNKGHWSCSSHLKQTIYSPFHYRSTRRSFYDFPLSGIIWSQVFFKYLLGRDSRMLLAAGIPRQIWNGIARQLRWPWWLTCDLNSYTLCKKYHQIQWVVGVNKKITFSHHFKPSCFYEQSYLPPSKYKVLLCSVFLKYTDDILPLMQKTLSLWAEMHHAKASHLLHKHDSDV